MNLEKLKLEYFACAFLMGLSCLSYELIFARLCVDYYGTAVVTQTWVIALFVLGMSGGVAIIAKQGPPESSSPRTQIQNIQLRLASSGASFVIVQVVAVWVSRQLGWSLLASKVIAGAGVFWVGTLCGREIPLLVRVLDEENYKNSLSLVLGFHAFGNLLATLGLTFLVLPHTSPLIALCLNACIHSILFFTIRTTNAFGKRGHWVPIVLMLVGSVVVFPRLEQNELKTAYFRLRLASFDVTALRQMAWLLKTIPDIERHQSLYQRLDIVKQNLPGMGNPEAYRLYLDRHMQFSSSSFRDYHEALAHAPFAFAGHEATNVLVLGGGDGLLAAELLRRPSVQKLVLVDIDPWMTNWARTDERIRALNRAALDDPKVRIVHDDAYRWVRHSNERFDAVFLDFPYPADFDLSRLYSVEFFRSLSKLFTIDAFVAFDVPLFVDPENSAETTSNQSVLSTLDAAGFRRVLPFALGGEGFIYADLKGGALEFRRDQFRAWMSEVGARDLRPLHYDLRHVLTAPRFVNSVFRPTLGLSAGRGE